MCNKCQYKVWLLFLKVTPVIIAVIYGVHTLLEHFSGKEFIFLDTFKHLSLPLLFLIITSFIFNFCIYHRIFLYYIECMDILTLVENTSLTFKYNSLFVTLKLILTVVVLITIIKYIYVKYNQTTTLKFSR